MVRKPVILVVAYTHESRTIGSRGQLPWHDHVLTQDMKTFKQLTTMTQDPLKRNAIVMGRRTWEAMPRKNPSSLPRALPGRLNVVLSSRERVGEEDGVIWTGRGMLPTLALLDADDSIETICIIGGTAMYREALDLGVVSAIYATEVGWEGKSTPWDAHFPTLPPGRYSEHVLHHDHSDPGYPLTFKCFLKKAQRPQI